MPHRFFEQFGRLVVDDVVGQVADQDICGPFLVLRLVLSGGTWASFSHSDKLFSDLIRQIGASTFLLLIFAIFTTISLIFSLGRGREARSGQ